MQAGCSFILCNMQTWLVSQEPSIVSITPVWPITSYLAEMSERLSEQLVPLTVGDVRMSAGGSLSHDLPFILLTFNS
jgi:hypothetical protein